MFSLPFLPSMTRPLRSSPTALVCTIGAVLSSCCNKAVLRGPLKRAGFHSLQYLKTTETRRTNMPSARRRHFCLLLLPGKSRASGGTRNAGSDLFLKLFTMFRKNRATDRESVVHIRCLLHQRRPLMRHLSFANSPKGQALQQDKALKKLRQHNLLRNTLRTQPTFR